MATCVVRANEKEGKYRVTATYNGVASDKYCDNSQQVFEYVQGIADASINRVCGVRFGAIETCQKCRELPHKAIGIFWCQMPDGKEVDVYVRFIPNGIVFNTEDK